MWLLYYFKDSTYPLFACANCKMHAAELFRHTNHFSGAYSL